MILQEVLLALEADSIDLSDEKNAFFKNNGEDTHFGEMPYVE
jgi:hypothetical protein